MITGLDCDEAREDNSLALHQEGRLKPLWLTREEALQLLELSITATAGLAQEGALAKLGDLCRDFLRDDRAMDGAGA